MSRPAYIYLKYCAQLELYKIGVSVNSEKRNISLQTGNPFEITTKEVFFSKYPYKVESAIHKELKSFKKTVNDIKLKGEWFNLPDEIASQFILKCYNVESSIDFLKKSGNIFI